MKKKVTQETANRLRELLEKVISEREDAAPLPKDHQIARILVPLFALCFAGVYLQNTYFFLLIGSELEFIPKLGVGRVIEALVIITNHYFLLWSVPFSCLFLETTLLQEGIQCFSGTSKGRNHSREKETTRDKSHPCKRTRRLFKNIANGISV